MPLTPQTPYRNFERTPVGNDPHIRTLRSTETVAISLDRPQAGVYGLNLWLCGAGDTCRCEPEDSPALAGTYEVRLTR